jgi:hypothetical protein
MKSFHPIVQAQSVRARSGKPGLRPWRAVSLPVVLLAVCLGLAHLAQAQVVPAADAGGMRLSAGGAFSGYYLNYGEQKLLGASAFVDADTLRHFGVEGEARWLTVHQTNDEHATTYLIGPRYSRYYGRFQPYVKGLVGIGQFNFPYNLGRDNCLVVAPGAGVDFRLSRRISWRAVDFEYQIWPQFYYGQMSSPGLSTGIRIRIF